jgi:peptidyl-prolyl cis-trans isomerase C
MSSEDDAVNGRVDVDAPDKEPEVNGPEVNGEAPADGAATTNGAHGADSAAQLELDVAQAKLDAAEARVKVAQAKLQAVQPNPDAAEAKPSTDPSAELSTEQAAKPAAEPAATAVVEPAAKTAETAETETAETEAEIKPVAVAEPEVTAAVVAAPVADAAPEAEKLATELESETKSPEPAEKPADSETAAPADKTETIPVTAAAAVGAESANKDENTDENKDENETQACAPAKSGVAALLRSTKAMVIAGVALLLVGCLAGGAYLWYYHNTHVPSNVVFRVDGQNVTVEELSDDVQTDQALYGFVPPAGGPALDRFRRDFAKATAVSMIIEDVANQRNIVVADREVSDTLARYIAQVYGPGDDGHTKFIQALASQGTSEIKVLQELKRQITLTKLTAQLTSNVQVSDQEVQQYFNVHRTQLATPELRDLHNIVVDTRDEGTDIINKIKAGASFDQLATQYSLDDSTKQQGGEMGHPVSAQELEPAYAQASFAAPVTGVFGPVQGSRGWNVGLVVAISPPAPAVFAQIQAPLRQDLIEQKQLAKWSQFLGDQIKEAGVVYNPVYRPADPDSLPSENDQQAPAGPVSAPAAGVPAPGAAPAPPK